VADPDRLGIGGWSYGGILTDATIARDGRFKAAVSGAGSANQIAMYGGDQYTMQYEHELGPPWRNLEVWLKVSFPFFHADRIRTPTLFIGGANDFNVPILGGEQMYQALRSLGVPTQLVIYPETFHVPSGRATSRTAWRDISPVRQNILKRRLNVAPRPVSEPGEATTARTPGRKARPSSPEPPAPSGRKPQDRAPGADHSDGKRRPRPGVRRPER
jgi:dienelactone hydrolase